MPRSSQWPSIVTCHAEYFFITAALACSTTWPATLTSELSSSKNSGCNGESRFRSSSDFEPMVSSTGIGGIGTGTGSDTGVGGGGGAGGAVIAAGGGGMGRATGGAFFEHAPTTTESRTTITINACARLFISDLNSIPVALVRVVAP